MTEPSPYQAEPVCPRHPDRVSYVRCQRCNRPTCPECQRPAVVGVDALDADREGQKSMRMPRTQFGATVTAGGRPVVTLAIVVICAVVWLLQQVSPQMTRDLAFVPVLGATEPWRFLTAAFAHSPGQVLHILFNMYALWVIGQYLEPLLGRIRFAILYLVSAFGGSVGYLLLASPPPLPLTQAGIDHSSWVVSLVGASGAVLGFVVPGIAWQAHLGGLLTGAALAGVITLTAPQSRRRLQLPALVAVTVLLAIGAVAKYAVTDDSLLRSIMSLAH